MGIVAACSKLRWRGLGAANRASTVMWVAKLPGPPAAMTSSPTANSETCVADGDHAAGALQAEQLAGRVVRRRLLGKHSHGQHQVHEVEAGGGDLDLDLVGLWAAVRGDAARRQRIQNSRPRHFDAERLRSLLRLAGPFHAPCRATPAPDGAHISTRRAGRSRPRYRPRRSVLRRGTRSPRASRSPDRPAGNAGSGIR